MTSFLRLPVFVLTSLLPALLSPCLAPGAEVAGVSPGVVVLPEGERLPAAIPEPLAVWSESRTAPRLNRIFFLKVALNDPSVEFFVRPGEDPDGPGPAESRLTPPRELLASGPALALMNANAFAGIPSIPDPKGKRGWYEGRAVNIAGLVVADGKVVSPDSPERTAFWIDGEGRPHLGHPGKSDTVRQAAADWFGPLLIDGKVVAGRTDAALLDEADKRKKDIDASLHPRSMIGFDDTGKWLLFAVVDGRQKGYSLGMSLEEEAALMKSKGCTQALNLDGGGSSILLYRDAAGRPVVANKPSDSGERPVPVMIGVRARVATAPAPEKPGDKR